MAHGRAVKYGRFLAEWAKHTINSIPEHQRENYKIKLIEELKNYSFESRRKGEPKNVGCVYELDDILEFNIKDPKHLGRLIKEGLHLLYLKPTAKRVLDSLLENL